MQIYLYSASEDYYNLAMEVNPYSSIEETTYVNNKKSTYLYYAPPTYPSVSQVSFNASGAYDNTDKELAFSLKLKNTGTSSYFNEYYNLIIKNSADAIVHSQSVIASIGSPNTTTTHSIPVSLTNALPVGEYTVEIKCSGGCQRFSD